MYAQAHTAASELEKDKSTLITDFFSLYQQYPSMEKCLGQFIFLSAGTKGWQSLASSIKCMSVLVMLE